MPSTKTIIKATAAVLAIYLVLSAAFFWISGEQLFYRDETTDMVNGSMDVGELLPGIELRQRFTVEGDELRAVSFIILTYGRQNTSSLSVRIEDALGREVGQADFPAADLPNGSPTTVHFPAAIPVKKGEAYDLVLLSLDASPGNAVTIWYGNTMTLSGKQLALTIPQSELLRLNGESLPGKLCFSLDLRERLWFGDYYWFFVLAFGVLVCLYGAYTAVMAGRGKATLVLRVCSAFRQYNYLIRQLVSRDFKTKYKRSVLGVLWSLLNPILTMTVQYIVFSNLFRSDIPNFALYLIIGIVCYNFFSESTSMTLTSIVGNAGLITKVYMPKYIYPFSRTVSSTVNLLFSLIPLFGVMLLTGTPVRPAVLLLPFGLLCLFLFSLGIGMLLATAMVFFRDTQFLWGIVCMLWMYLTPIIYPESIIPAQYMTLYRCNPLYHVIRFIRTVLMDGISPEPMAYALCLLSSCIPLLLGVLVFWKKQNEFVVNL